ncbi:acyl-CoA dehydrogenase [Arthrobacter sp. Soil762]|nr:acyl-CoA dehydrogenase [Arthrobacter sp. Soil762]
MITPDQADIGTDFYLMDEFLTAEERELRGRVRNFVDKDLLPVINGYWERAEFPFELIPKLAALGIIGSTIQGFGCPGLSRLAAGMVATEISRGDGSVNTFLGVQSGLAMGTINMLGSQEQKERWLPEMAALGKIGAFALTEPDHGSDSVALETSARRDGDSYIISGRKRWIGNASMADVVIIFARDEDDSKVKAFVMERNDDGTYPAGYSTEVITGKIGKRAILQPDITLDNVRVPARNRLTECHSFKDVTRVLTSTRSGASWESLGHAIAAYEAAVAYSKSRQQFGRPIASFQLVQNKLANMLAELTAMQLICFRLAVLAEDGRMTGPMASLAKMHTAQKARWICSEARDMLGGNGVLLENHVARHMTDMEVVSTYEGTDSIQSLLVGREITGISAFS